MNDILEIKDIHETLCNVLKESIGNLASNDIHIKPLTKFNYTSRCVDSMCFLSFKEFSFRKISISKKGELTFGDFESEILLDSDSTFIMFIGFFLKKYAFIDILDETLLLVKNNDIETFLSYFLEMPNSLSHDDNEFFDFWKDKLCKISDESLYIFDIEKL